MQHAMMQHAMMQPAMMHGQPPGPVWDPQLMMQPMVMMQPQSMLQQYYPMCPQGMVPQQIMVATDGDDDKHQTKKRKTAHPKEASDEGDDDQPFPGETPKFMGGGWDTADAMGKEDMLWYDRNEKEKLLKHTLGPDLMNPIRVGMLTNCDIDKLWFGMTGIGPFVPMSTFRCKTRSEFAAACITHHQSEYKHRVRQVERLDKDTIERLARIWGWQAVCTKPSDIINNEECPLLCLWSMAIVVAVVVGFATCYCSSTVQSCQLLML